MWLWFTLILWKLEGYLFIGWKIMNKENESLKWWWTLKRWFKILIMFHLVKLRPWDFPGKSTGVGWHFLLQGIFPTRWSNLGLLHCRQMLYPLSHQRSHGYGLLYFPPKERRKGTSSFESVSTLYHSLFLLFEVIYSVYFTSLHFLKNWAPVSVSSSCTSTIIFMVVLFIQYSNLSCLGLISSTDTGSILPLFFIAWILLLLTTSSLAVQFLASYSLTTTSCFSSWLPLLLAKVKTLQMAGHWTAMISW